MSQPGNHIGSITMNVRPEDVQPGDLILLWEFDDGATFGGGIPTRLVTRVTSDEIYVSDRGGPEFCWYTLTGSKPLGSVVGVLVIRPLIAGAAKTYQGTFPVDDEDTEPGVKPGKKAVPDWPLRCPRCGRANSAVLLFQTYDCKHGCYAPSQANP